MNATLCIIGKKVFSREVVMYGVTGILTTILNICVTYVMHDKWGWNENLVTILSWFIVVTAAYICNAIWVFESKFTTLKSEMVKIGKFFASRVFTYIVEAIGVYVFITKLNHDFWVVKTALIVIVVILNYLFAKFLVFLQGDNSKKGKEDETETKVQESEDINTRL